ncbi:hypothetical protein D3C76_1711140 [compost metagenome]
MLGLVLHTLGNDGQLHAAAQGDDRAGDGGVVGVVGQAADERFVDLEDVQRQALEVAQR